jgi:hypothetical protein
LEGYFVQYVDITSSGYLILTVINISTVDSVEFGRATVITLGDAKEEAAHIALVALRGY